MGLQLLQRGQAHDRDTGGLEGGSYCSRGLQPFEGGARRFWLYHHLVSGFIVM
jgi:hypothetical protein